MQFDISGRTTLGDAHNHIAPPRWYGSSLRTSLSNVGTYLGSHGAHHLGYASDIKGRYVFCDRRKDQKARSVCKSCSCHVCSSHSTYFVLCCVANVEATIAPHELLFTLYLYSGLRPLVSEKVTSDNWNLRNVRYNKKYLSRNIGTNDIWICTSNYPSRTIGIVSGTILKFIYFFGGKQQQIFITCCWQYCIRNQRTQLPLNNRWNHVARTILKFVYFFGRKQQQIFTTCCWQYHIRNHRTRLPLYNRWNHVSRTIPINIPIECTLATEQRTNRQHL